MKLENLLPGTKKSVFLKNHTTFKIGGRAKYFYKVRNKENLVDALNLAKKAKLPFFIFGQGSNVLASDKGFKGLVIKLDNSEFMIHNSRLYAQAGVLFSKLVRETGKKSLSGLEWAGGLPGTLGAAIFGNAGAFGGETKDAILQVEFIDNNLNIRKFAKKQCQFKYRSSIFKKRSWIVISAVMKLKRGDKKKIHSISNLHIKQRKKRGPLEYANAGSIFKNCDIKNLSEKVVKEFKDVIKKDPFPVIPAAAIIAKVPGLVGKKIGRAQVSKKHPNFIINLGGARAKDVSRLIGLVKSRVKDKFGVNLEEEIRRIGT